MLSGLPETAVIPKRVCDKFAQFSATVQAKKNRKTILLAYIVMTVQAYWI